RAGARPAGGYWADRDNRAPHRDELVLSQVLLVRLDLAAYQEEARVAQERRSRRIARACRVGPCGAWIHVAVSRGLRGGSLPAELPAQAGRSRGAERSDRRSHLRQHRGGADVRRAPQAAVQAHARAHWRAAWSRAARHGWRAGAGDAI